MPSALTPQEIALIQAVYDDLLGRPWMHRNAVTEKELAKLLLVAFQAGMVEFEALRAHGETEARKRFSRGR